MHQKNTANPVSSKLVFSFSTIKIACGMDDITGHKTCEYYGWVHDRDKILNRFDKERMQSGAAVMTKAYPVPPRNKSILKAAFSSFFYLFFIPLTIKNTRNINLL